MNYKLYRGYLIIESQPDASFVVWKKYSPYDKDYYDRTSSCRRWVVDSMEDAKKMIDEFIIDDARKIEDYIVRCINRRAGIYDALCIIHSTRCTTSYSNLEREYITLGNSIENAKRDLHDILNKEDK